ncbi:PQQ-binding-like beta-propeller repeat protein [Rugosimonospora africana]|uniref:PQQ-like domain-containing protein n=1 Tax=Rugosimonospora africana TaxID=556532 RepID=A0A8J3R178_9ACTN|nr:PQQ-binding-like beta-propeller repeat protein [Rugosimonospora africana]GIH19742.1 hypothetical protein Raf01_79140 [Rugosimonospora africana]
MRRRTLLATPALAAGAALLPATAAEAAGTSPSAPAGTSPSAPAGTSPSAPAGGGQPVPLAVPLHDVNVIGGRVLTLPDGTPMLYGVTTGTPAKLSGVDARSGVARFSVPLPDADGSYTVVAGTDGSLYAGAYDNGRLYRVSADGATVTDLGQPLADQTFLWDLAVAPDGRLFGVTYPGARLFAYDPAGGGVHDYGAVTADTTQARTVEVVGATVYVGTMTPAHLFAIDAASGAKTELPLPSGVDAATQSIFDVNAAGGLLYVRIGTDIKYSPLYALDPATGQWSAPLSQVAGLELPAPDPDGRVYVMRNNELTAWDPASGASSGTGLVYPGRVYNYRGVGWVDLADPDWPGQTLTGWFWRGELWRYNPETGKSWVSTDSTLPGEPIPVISLASAHDGTVLAGGYLGGFARVDPDDATVQFHRFSQTERLLDDGTAIWLGTYPDARGYRYDPARPWSSPEYSPGPPGTPDNPVTAWNFAGYADPQDRILSLARVGDYLIGGTGPKGPTFGGALAVYDTGSGQARFTATGLGDRAASALAAPARSRADIVYVGTWTQGGTGAGTPPETLGTVFAYDIGRDRVLWQRSPVPGAARYAALLFDTQGRLWTVADSTLAELNPANGKVRRSVRLGDPVSGGTWPAEVAILQPAPGGQALYVKSGGRVWWVSTRTLAATDLGLPGYREFTALPCGDLVLALDEQLYRWTPPARLRGGA